MLCKTYVATLSYSDVTAGNQEQDEDTPAVISCTVTGLTKKLDDVTWKNDDDETITASHWGFVIDAAGTNAGFIDNTQITTLSVPGNATDQDKTYKCVINSVEHGETDKSTSVNLKVFSK